jgi:hypothetical protein
MAREVQIGTIQLATLTNGATHDINLSGFTGKPNFMMFWICGRQSAINAVGVDHSDWCIGIAHAAASGFVDNVIRNDAILALVSHAATGAANGLVDIQSVSETLVRLVNDSVLGEAQTVGYCIARFNDVYMGDFTEAGATGNVVTSPTGLNFVPKAGFFLGTNSSTFNTIAAGAAFSFGIATATEQFCHAMAARDAQTTMDTATWNVTSGAVLGIANPAAALTAAPVARASLSSFNAAPNGFTLNWAARTATARRFFYCLIGDGDFDLDTFVSSTVLNTANPRTLDFTPSAALLISSGVPANIATAVVQAHSTVGLGAAKSPTDRFAFSMRDQDNVADASITTAIRYDAIGVHAGPTGVLNGLLDISAWDNGAGGNGINFAQDDADTVAALQQLLAFRPTDYPDHFVTRGEWTPTIGPGIWTQSFDSLTTGPRRAMIVGVCGRTASGVNGISAAAYGGQAMTALGATISTAGMVTRFFVLVNPPTGVNDLEITLVGGAGTAPFAVGAIVYKHINQTTPVDNYVASSGVTNIVNFTGNVTSESGDLPMWFVAMRGNLGSAGSVDLMPAGHAERIEAIQTNVLALTGGDGIGAPSVPMGTWTSNAGAAMSDWATIAFNLNTDPEVRFKRLTAGSQSGTSDPVTASISLGADKLGIMIVTGVIESPSAPDTPVIAGWTEIGQTFWTDGAGFNARLIAYRRKDPAITTGTITINGAQVAIWNWEVYEVQSADPAGVNGAGAIVQFKVANANNTAAPAAAFDAAFGDTTNNATLIAVASGGASALMTPEAGFTPSDPIGSGYMLRTAHRLGEDATPSATLSGNRGWGIIALEIKSVHAAAGGGGTTLTVQETLHAEAVDNPALTQANTLAVQESLHAFSSEVPSLIQGYSVLVQEALHGHAAESPALVQANLLAVQEALHAHGAESFGLTQANTLAVQDAVHILASEVPGLIQQYLLAVQDALHAQVAESFGLLQGYTLGVNDANHTNAVDNIVLEFGAFLAVADALHGLTSETFALTQNYVLAVQEAHHLHGADNLALTQAHLLAVQEALHTLGSDVPSLSQTVNLAVQDTLHAHIAVAPTLSIGFILNVGKAVHQHAVDNIALIQQAVLSVQDAYHFTTAGSTIIRPEGWQPLEFLSLRLGFTKQLARNFLFPPRSIERELRIQKDISRKIGF